MRFIPTLLQDAYLVEMERRSDQRGFFARAFCAREYAQVGLATDFCQINNSVSTRKSTLRGMHFQVGASAEVKIVRCLRGALFDVIADLRPDSPTFGRWYGAILDAENRSMMYVPRGFAHGFLTLDDDTEVLYLASAYYAPQAERGLRWDDPWLGIVWPTEPVEISMKDRAWPPFDPALHGIEGFRGLAARGQEAEEAVQT